MHFYLFDKTKEVTKIMLRAYVAKDKRDFVYSTGQSIKTSEWDFSVGLPKSKRGEQGKENARVRAILDKFSSFYEDTVNDNSINPYFDISRQYLKEKFDLKFKGVVTVNKVMVKSLYPSDYLDEFLEEKKNAGTLDKLSLQKYKTSVGVFIEFEESIKKYKFEDINDDLFPKYLAYIRTEKQYQDSTLHRHLKFLKTYWSWVFKKNKKDRSGYDNWSYSNREADKIALSEEDLELLENYNPVSKYEEEVVDTFLIGCYSGQRFSDYSLFRSSDIRNNMLVKVAEKTTNISYIPLHPKLKVKLEKYNYNVPDLTWSQSFNRTLQRICVAIGMEEEVKITEFRGNSKKEYFKKRGELVGSHTARRTFITLSHAKGMTDKTIMSICGIKDIKTLHKYIKINEADIISQTINAWG